MRSKTRFILLLSLFGLLGCIQQEDPAKNAPPPPEIPVVVTKGQDVPLFQEFVGQVPSLSITISEPNIDSIWYTIDGGVNNYTMIPPPGWTTQSSLGETINQEAWDAAPYGTITIGVYITDTMGNIGYSEIDIEKAKPSQGIPGYTLLLFISTLGVITAITLKKKYKRNLKYDI